MNEENNDAPQGSADAEAGSSEVDSDDVSQLQSAVEKFSSSKPEAMTEMMAMMGVGPAPNPIHQKMEGSHITQILNLAADHDEREYKLRQDAQSSDASSRWWRSMFVFAAFVIIMAFVSFVFYAFEDKPEILIPTLTGLGGPVSGFVGGFGIGRKSSSFQ